MSVETLIARETGIDTQDLAVAYMRRDCAICRSEGFSAMKRIRLSSGDARVVATLHVVDNDSFLKPREVGLSKSAWQALGVSSGKAVDVHHATPLSSLAYVRSRIFGHPMSSDHFSQIIGDVAAGRYSDVEIATFVTVCAAIPLDLAERVALTRAMLGAGETLSWSTQRVFDKHCIGGLPGNRTTPIVVAIAAAAGLRIPKTSSRAITSPAGTADVVETLMPVELSIAQMQEIVRQENGCLAWGGAVNLSPADDRLIRIERAIDIDSEGQLVASVLSKKLAAGSTDVLIDIPVGPTAKVRTAQDAERLGESLVQVGAALGLRVQIHRSDGSQPVGNGLGPANEARDVLAVLQGLSGQDHLRSRALDLAGMLLEMGEVAPQGSGRQLASDLLASGRAWQKFQAIAQAQGGLREPPKASHLQPIVAGQSGLVTGVDNRRLARLAKLAGAPDSPAAGIELLVRLGDEVRVGQPMMVLTAQSPGELAYATEYAADNSDIWRVE